MRPDQTIGERAINTRLTKLGATCADTIVWTCRKAGEKIFGRSLRMFRKNPLKQFLHDLIHQNLGAQTIFIGKKVVHLLKIAGNICVSGKGNPEPQILTITSMQNFKKNTALLLSGIVNNFQNKTMSAQFVNSQKLLLSEAR